MTEAREARRLEKLLLRVHATICFLFIARKKRKREKEKKRFRGLEAYQSDYNQHSAAALINTHANFYRWIRQQLFVGVVAGLRGLASHDLVRKSKHTLTTFVERFMDE